MAAKTVTHESYNLATVDGGKVHLAFGWEHGAPSCDRSEQITDYLADLDPNAGLEGTVAAILANDIPIRRLCAHCFPIRTRKAVSEARAAAKDAR